MSLIDIVPFEGIYVWLGIMKEEMSGCEIGYCEYWNDDWCGTDSGLI